MREEKLAPIHPGEVLQEEFLKPMALSQNRVAIDIGVPAGRINEIVSGKSFEVDANQEWRRLTVERYGCDREMDFDPSWARKKISLRYDLKILVFGALTVLSLAACQSSTGPAWRWERAEAGLPRRMIVAAVAGDPVQTGQLWLGAYTPGGLAASVDGGQTWLTNPAGVADNPVFDLLVPSPSDKRPPGEVWAATRDGLLRSLDSGASWQRVGAGLPPEAVFAVTSDAAGRLYAGLDNAGVYARRQNGAAWEALTGEEPLASAAVLSLAVSPDGEFLYAGTAGQGLFASRDGGRTWQAAYAGRYVPTLALNPADPTQAVASLRDRLVRTQDGGRSWRALAVPWAREEIFSLLWLPDGTLGAGTGTGRLYRSQDGGDSWLAAEAGLAHNSGAVLDLSVGGAGFLLAGAWTGLYGSSNGGETWRELAPSLGAPQAQALLAAENTLWLGARTGLFRWQASSQAWVPAPAEFPPGGLQSLALDPAGVLYAGTSGDGLYRSDDAGRNWRRLPSPGVGIPALSIDPANSDHLYILAAWERVYESKDGGQTWLANWDGLGETLETASVAVDTSRQDGSVVYLGSERGLYRSRNTEDWEFVAPALADQSILVLLLQPTPAASGGRSILYIGATRGLYRSLDAGRTVQTCTAPGLGWGCGLENISVTALLADPAASNILYAGTAYAGVYQSLDWGRVWQPIGPADLAADVVESLAWGPEGALFVAAESGVWRGEER